MNRRSLLKLAGLAPLMRPGNVGAAEGHTVAPTIPALPVSAPDMTSIHYTATVTSSGTTIMTEGDWFMSTPVFFARVTAPA